MQQFMTQVTSTMQAAQEIRQSRSEDEWFVTDYLIRFFLNFGCEYNELNNLQFY